MSTAPDQLFRYPITVERVVDGDTLYGEIDLGFKIRLTDYIRLFGVNCPERRGETRQAGQEAMAFSTSWIRQRTGLWIHSRVYDEREKYGRILATVRAEKEEESLNDALLRHGHAERYA